MILVDTNLLLRAILQDDIVQAKATRAFFEQARDRRVPLVVHELALAEVVWVLQGRGWSRDQISITLLEICADARLAVRDMAVVEAAAGLYQSNNVSYIDAFHAAYANVHGMEGILSFDQDFDRLKVKRFEPRID